MFLAVALASLATLGAAGYAAYGANHESEVRIVARRLDDGRTEFGLQQRGTDGEWAERQLPTRRFFPADPGHGRWLSSSPLGVAPPPKEPFEGSGSVNGVVFNTVSDEFTDETSTRVSVSERVGEVTNRASLDVWCRSSGTFSVWLISRDWLSDYDSQEVDVTHRLDEAPHIVERWKILGFVQTAVYLAPPDERAFYDSLRGAETLRLRTPTSRTLTFDLSDFLDTPAQVNIDACDE